jgi:hypothetical protein
VPGDPLRVAVVGGRSIPMSRLEQRMAEMRLGPRARHLPPDGGVESVGLRRWVVQELVTEAVLEHEARAAGIVGAPAGSDLGAGGSTTSQLSASVIARLVERVTGSVTVGRREVRAYYVRNADRYRRPETRRVRHILVDDEAAARSAMDRLVDGDEMGELAAGLSTDAGSRSRGGDLGDVHRGELSGALEDAIFGAEVGALIGPIRTEHGWHVVRLEAVTPATTVPYREARQEIAAELLAAARIEAFGDWLARRRAAIAVIEPGFEHPAHPIHGFPSHRH